MVQQFINAAETDSQSIPVTQDTPRISTIIRKPANYDQWVLRPENQNQVCLTPLVADLAALGYAGVERYDTGRGPRLDGKLEQRLIEEEATRMELQRLCDKAYSDTPSIYFEHRDIRKRARYMRGQSTFAQSVMVDGIVYEVRARPFMRNVADLLTIDFVYRWGTLLLSLPVTV